MTADVGRGKNDGTAPHGGTGAGEGDKPAPSAREVRLAQALRTNLRRRKAGPPPAGEG